MSLSPHLGRMNNSGIFPKEKSVISRNRNCLHLTPLPPYTVPILPRRDTEHQAAKNSLGLVTNNA